ncbi:MAG: SDR family NAD(P)-dependent oxidoreductase [Steroidobacteraceae bacterium]
MTGGSRGLGLATAVTLAAAGYRVLAIARQATPELLAASHTAAGEALGAIEFRACDLIDLAAIPVLIRSLRTQFGPIYGLINNAGAGTGGVLGNMRDQDIERLVHLNTISPIVVTKYAARSMMTEREGRIVNISSVVASAGYHSLSVYSATKASLLGFTRSLARELGPLGITVNAVAPGFIATDMTKDLNAAQREQITKRSALRRLPDAVDVARSIAHLLSAAGRNITGTVLTVDAGNTA